MTSSTALAHPHGTRVAVYPALFIGNVICFYFHIFQINKKKKRKKKKEKKKRKKKRTSLLR